MTEKQQNRIKDRITGIKKDLAADKRKWGGYYDDSRGLRYAPPELYLKIKDYKGALRYFNWFEKNFPDDIGFPGFLFEYTLTLFKNKKIEKAENKVLETFISNPYLIDYFLDKELTDYYPDENSEWKKESLKKYFIYSKHDPGLEDFIEWLEIHIGNPKFLSVKNEIIEIENKLITERREPTRTALVKRLFSLIK